jgi:pimeloyl-ACP methyl ester carboxylesterase
MTTTATMQTFTSPDGTRIAYQLAGDGPPLVLVHGGIEDHTYFHPALPALASHFTVYVVERRGRGHSGDTEPYAVEREYEDVVTLVDSIGEPVILLGRSYGALVSIEAALRTGNVRTLVLYEPPFDPDGFGFPPAFLERLESRLAAGDHEGVIRTMMSELVGLSPEELQQLEASEAWPAIVATAHTLPRELRSVAAYRFDPQRFRSLMVPTVLLEGDQSPDELRVGVRLLEQTLPDARLVTMKGTGHEANQTHPDIFTEALFGALEV